MKDLISRLIEGRLHFAPGTRSILEPSVQYYHESGKVSGELFSQIEQIVAIAKTEIKLYDPLYHKPPYAKDVHGYDLDHSITVLIIDSDECDGLAWYDYRDEKWYFLTEHVQGARWLWYYRPFSFSEPLKERLEKSFLEIPTD